MASGQKKRQAERDAQNASVATAAAKQVEPSALQKQREGIYGDILTNGPQSKYAQPNVSQLALYKRNRNERDRAGAYGFGARYADPNLLAAMGSQEEARAAESDAVNAEAMYQQRFNDALGGSLNEDQLMAQKYGSVIGMGRNETRETSPWSTALTTGLSVLPFLSDVSLKHEIKPVRYGLREVMELNPVDWKWNSNEQEEMGLIAQEVLKVLPELVVRMDETGLLGIKYAGLLPVMLKAMQEQNKLIENLQARLEAVEESK
jgi:hypothetical protein